jgi:hypothetical protein
MPPSERDRLREDAQADLKSLEDVAGWEDLSEPTRPDVQLPPLPVRQPSTPEIAVDGAERILRLIPPWQRGIIVLVAIGAAVFVGHGLGWW